MIRLKTWVAGALLFTAAVATIGAIEKEPLAEYAARRARLTEQIKGSALVLFGAPDTELARFKQEDNFYYLTGFNEPGAVLLLDATGDQAREILFVPRRNSNQERWTGATLSPGAQGEKETGLKAVRVETELSSALSPLVETRKRIYTLTSDPRSTDRLRDMEPSLETRNVAPLIAELRLRKSETELALIMKAVDMTLRGHEAAARTIAPGAWEYEVEAALEFEFRRRGAERPSFPSIVGSGPNSITLHYNENSRQMRAGDLVVVDVGAEYGHYAADVTRTYPVGGKFSPRQREIYQIVLDAQKEALAQVKPGATISEIHRAAMSHIRSKGYEREFTHGTSHHLGLYVHDVGDLTRPLEPGMVLTVEPGIYLEDEALGVRIEDDVVVTATGYRMLSDFPREIAQIEALMARSSGNSQR